MLTVVEALRAITGSLPDFGTVEVSVSDARGRVLRQEVRAERDQPPFDRVTMDGIAIRFEAFAHGNRAFHVQGTQHAGDPVQTLAARDNCIEIMTGGVLPEGSDCVIPVERIRLEGEVATLESGYEPKHRQFIHPQASDYAQGHVVLRPGVTISPMDIAIVASCGLLQLTVARQPVVRVISTGNELVPAGAAIAAHQVRLSNGPAVVAMLAQQRFEDTVHHHLPDAPKVLFAELARMLEEADVLILSGGVSMGQADYVPQVLSDLGVTNILHKIRQRPGKPMWFGIGPRQQLVFAVPGNPVSTLVCCRHYVLPALLAASGREPMIDEYARLTEDISFAADLTCFMPVTVTTTVEGVVHATPVPTNTSGDFASLGGTDGYVELPRGEDFFAEGRPLRLHRWDRP